MGEFSEIPLLTEKKVFPNSVKICYTNVNAEDFYINLSFMHSSDSYTSDSEWLEDYEYWSVYPKEDGCENYLFYLQPWFYNTPQKWIFQAEVIRRNFGDNANAWEQSVISQRKFFSEILFEKKSGEIQYNENNYTVTMITQPF
ncbi:hypothetical protein RF11_01468 [Thelohanellus kitauei]|uniref:Uncharacterized protein n=1 Tax=Thelohanellus kitauei TaxID=669202 RepID=A0A0C2MQP4_THEKT|nr:hypothetical protein RF11_01468 [Thelohanellus kitauei]